MRLLKNLTTPIALIAILLLFAGQSIFSFSSFSKLADSSSEEILKLKGKNESIFLNGYFDSISRSGSLYTEAFASAEKLDEASMINVLKKGILVNKFLLSGGIWMEPYALDSKKEFYGSYLYKKDSNVEIISDYEKKYGDYKKLDWYKQAIKSKTQTWSKPYKDSVTGKEIIIFSSPINKNGKLIGIATLSIELNELLNHIKKIKFNKSGHAFLLSNEGFYLGHKTKKSTESILNDTSEEVRNIGKKIIKNPLESINFANIDGQRYYFIASKLSSSLYLVLTVPYEEVHSDISKTININIILLILAELIGLILVLKIIDLTNNLRKKIEEKNAAEKALKIANERLELLDKIKTDFLSTVSHELRTPLTSIVGFAVLILKKLENSILPEVNGKSQRIVNHMMENLCIIISESKRLTSLINDLLDIAKMEAGEISFKSEDVNIKKVIETAVAMTLPLANAKELILSGEMEENLPVVYGNYDRLIQVVINLLSNAIKFTNIGYVSYSIRHKGNYLYVSIKDSGVGIPEDYQSKVFEKFKQVGDTLTEKPTGTGLGLPICKQIIEMHGGTLWLESKVGLGSTFTFKLPVTNTSLNKNESKVEYTPLSIPQSNKPSQNAMEFANIETLTRVLKHYKAEAFPVQTKKTILIVDDDHVIRLLLKQVLITEKYTVLEATNGLEAIEIAKANMPDLIILDVLMPSLNGFDVAAVLRHDISTAKIPIIIHSIIEDKDRGLKLGIDKYITKPFDVESLLKEIEDIFINVSDNKKLLIINDETARFDMLLKKLKKKSYEYLILDERNHDRIEEICKFGPEIIIVDAEFSKENDLQTKIRAHEGLEDVLFFLLVGGEENVISEA